MGAFHPHKYTECVFPIDELLTPFQLPFNSLQLPTSFCQKMVKLAVKSSPLVFITAGSSEWPGNPEVHTLYNYYALAC